MSGVNDPRAPIAAAPPEDVDECRMCGETTQVGAISRRCRPCALAAYAAKRGGS